jgi:L-histidine N-alpha-methyltransferase
MAVHRSPSRSLVVTPRDPRSQFRADVLTGLSHSPRQIPSKYFYDARGSDLFDRICELPEYYLTRTELAIMRRHAGAMAEALGPRCLLVEYGSGSSLKTPLLIEALRTPAGYVPVDISRKHLMSSADRLARRFPNLDIYPVWTDFTKKFELPEANLARQRTAVYFPGSTIGNFEPAEAIDLMKDIARLVGPGGALLIGVDVRKPAEIVEPAYNDRAGVTAEFNLNLLARINSELEGHFDLASFAHRAFFDPHLGRIEMHLVSLKNQVVRIGEATFAFKEGESIRTEYSHKYCPERFARLAKQAGFEMQQAWLDDERLFSVLYLTAA